MDLLTQAAESVFNTDDEDLWIPLTPTKGSVPHTPVKRKIPVFSDLTNTINISPNKFSNSPLQALFNAPTLNTPKTKSRTIINVNGSRNVGRGSGGKSISSPLAGGEVGTPKRCGLPPNVSHGKGSQRSPLTPMANLKLLTRIASMEESLSMSSKKVLFEKERGNQENSVGGEKSNQHKGSSASMNNTGITLRRYNSECLGQRQNKTARVSSGSLRKHPTTDNYAVPSSPGNLVLEGIGRIPSVDETNTARPLEVSRKDKSLGLLSEKFLEQFPLEVTFLETPRRLVIDEVAAALKTERRRVYDIINVLESLNMATRVQKNMYQWTGKLHLEETLGRLKALGEKHGFADQIRALREGENDLKVVQKIRLTKFGDTEKPDTRKEKSLSILCQKFLMILLVSPEPHIISLDNAIRLLVGEVGESGDRLRARGRRLYDIANVLTSLGLVRRVPVAKAFQYVGPPVSAVINDEDTFGILQRHSLLPSRHVANACKENANNYGNHEVTPSDVAPPVQKRGRPRKLATAFSTSALPAPKRSRLQRAYSEDIISSQSGKMTRNPSLDDICQVAEVEREKLLKAQHSCRSSSSDGIAKRSCTAEKIVSLPNSDFRPIYTAPTPSTSILQRRLMNRAKIPVALTFQAPERSTFGGQGHPSSLEEENAKENRSTDNLDSKALAKPKSVPVICHYPKPLRSPVVNKVLQSSKKATHSSEMSSMPNNSRSLPTGQPVLVAQPFCAQSYRNVVHQKREPIIIVRGPTTSTIRSENYSQSSRVVPVSPSVSQGAQVIKVITKTTSSTQQNASTVMTVMPAYPGVKTMAMKPTHSLRDTSGSFQQLSDVTYTNGQRILVSSSNPAGPNSCNSPGGKPFDAKPLNSSYVVFTLSDNQVVGQRTLSKGINSKGLPLSFRHVQSSLQPGPSKSDEQLPNGIGALATAPLRQDRSGVQLSSIPVGGKHQQMMSDPPLRSNHHANGSTWQPSPNGSSTDSELEQIFGDTFNFSRPKALVYAKASRGQDTDHTS